MVGRGKDLVISGGYNIYPKVLNKVLDELPGAIVGCRLMNWEKP